MPKLFRPYEVLGPSCLVILFMQSSDSVLSSCLARTTTSEFIIINSEPNTTDPITQTAPLVAHLLGPL